MAQSTQTATTTSRHWIRTTALALALVTTTGWMTTTVQSAAAASDTETHNNTSPDEAAPFTTEEAEAVAATQRLYAAWGLQFPDASIRFHSDSTTPCKGHAGLYRQWPQGRPTVDVCYPGDDPEIGHLMRASVLWHEVAHAYIEPTIDNTAKASFLDLVGLQIWLGDNWDQAGAEYAAEILVWGMMSGNHRLMVSDLECDTMSTAYTILSGLEGPSC